MKIMKNSGFAGSLLLIGALIFSGGCGYKNSPVPPQTVVPKAIEDLRFNVEDDGVTLTWTYPVETVSGKNLEEIDSFELFRVEISLADYCGGCPIPFGEPMAVPGGVTVEEEQIRRAQYESGMLKSGYKYFFKIRSRTSWWASSDDSNIVSFVYHTPAAAPAELEATTKAKKVTLNWASVTTLTDGKPVDLPLSYQVLRSLNGKEYFALGSAVTTTEFVDDKVKVGQIYYYKVKSSMVLDDELLHGSLSDSVKITIADRTPPPVVTGVRVVAASKNNRIFWDRLKDDDLAGYRVYRRTADKKKATLIGKASATQTIFMDYDLLQDTKVYYSVTAIDNSTPPNESKRSKEVTTRD